jgi:RND family efflux transporter MFP subunit
MRASRTTFLATLALVADFAIPAHAGEGPPPARFTVALEKVDDFKSVFATVRSKDLIEARVRTPGTLASLSVDEGSFVEPGQVMALVADPKIALRIKSIDAQMTAVTSRIETARAELERAETLKSKGVSPQSRVDQAQTAFDVATNDLKAIQAERSVVVTQIDEGQVLAPAAGRVLKVPVTEGSVVMSGESIATIAANVFLLRLELPERHAQFMKVGDPVRLGARGINSDSGPLAEGRIVQVYPELSNGRVIADADVPGLGSYFVGERVLVWISAGKRDAYAVPKAYVFKRFGLDYVRLANADGSRSDVVVQLGQVQREAGENVEVLAGLKAGDTLVQP